jgi:hypothetical protein
MTARTDELTADLASGDRERIRRGLAGLRALVDAGSAPELPAIEPWLLQPFGEAPPGDVVSDLARVLARAPLAPRPSRPRVIRQLVELAVRHDVPQVLDELLHEIERGDGPAGAREAVDYLRARGIASRELAAAQQLVGRLLAAGSPVRRAAADALALWSPTDTKAAIVAAVLPRVDPDQRVQMSAPDPDRKTLPPMKFDDVAVNRKERYALGVERNSGRYYIAIPASNGIIDYDEYYEIDKDMFERFRADLDSALPFVERCRNRLEDPRLMYQPSTRRGTPT